MEDDEYPNFGSAFPTETTPLATEEQASWNPALRPNTHRRNESRVTNVDDDFFDRYPGPTPEKPRRLDPRDEEGESLSGRQETSPLSLDAMVNDDAVEPEQQPLESQKSIHLEDDPSPEEPSANYEHQSATTALEDAIDESAQAPLIEDEQPLPTVSTITREGTLAEESGEPEIKNVTRSFTTNFTEIPAAASTIPEAVTVSSDWPAVGDDKTFADLLDGETPGLDVVPDKKPLEEDLTAAWAAALDDDDILDDNELDPTTFFGDDDDGFLLEDDETNAVSAPSVRPAQQQRSVSAYVPSSTQPSIAPSPFINQSHGRSEGTPSTGLYEIYNQHQPLSNPSTRPSLPSTQSFADKPKSGYQSPYDLPMEVVKTRRRPAATQSSTSLSSMPAAPPRTSSFGAANPSPPNSSHGLPDGPATAPVSAKSTPQPNAAFFEDLPMAARARARPSSTYSPSLNGMPTPPFGPSQPQFSSQQPPPPQQPPLRTSQSYAPPQAQTNFAGGFRQPEKAPLFPDQITPPSTMQSQILASSPSQPSNRYSPAPQAGVNTARYSPASQGQPKTTQRYSSSPSAIPSLPPSRSGQSFVPRTSSPLAVHGRPQAHSEQSTEQLRSVSTILPSSPGKAFEGDPSRRGSTTSRYAPSNASTGPDSASLPAFTPQRQRTQSPSEFKKLPAIAQMPNTSLLSSQPAAAPMRLSHRRQFSRDLPYAAPGNDSAHDPLERWKGHAIFHWNDAGMIVSSIPKHTPFYASGAVPTLKCTSGDVKTYDATAFPAIEEHDAKFPGPLPVRSKGKKKDLLNWVTLKVDMLRRDVEASALDFSQSSEQDRRGKAEKLLLWQIMRIYLENDGVLEGSPKLETEVRQLLLPDLAEKGQVMALQSPTSTSAPSETVDPTAIYQIRQALFEGQRDRAILLAEEKRLWGHAMLIASTAGPESFRQIVSSFVRNQVKSSGDSELKSLSALYQVFAGNPEDCVDELVPPSARAGFQMISTTDGRGSTDSLSGLDQWRETLSLMHSNPTPSNSASLLAIGKLLATYDRIEAAHICFLFARSLAKHSGADDPDAHFVLLGADAAQGHVDLDSLMLTEIYEYATSLSSPSTAVHYIAHLQSYKLIHARHLAASGHKAKAVAYCEHIDAAIRSTTRPSGYYHQQFAQELMSLNAMLAQSAHSGSAGGKFFSRPSIDKVSSGMGSWFTKFVSGEEGDTDSNTSGQGVNDAEASGPFGGVTSTVISRNTSVTDLQGGVPFSPPALTQPFQFPSSPNRYTPLGQGAASRYAPSSAAQFGGSRTSLDSERSVPAPASMPSSEPIRSSSARYAPAPNGQSPAMLGVQSAAISRRTSNQSLASTGSYEPRPILAEQDGFGHESPSLDPVSAEHFSPPSIMEEPMINGAAHETSNEGPDSESGGYAPPTMSYEPPTYQPWQPEPEAEGDQASAPKPKKKSFMDDDDEDDYASRAAALKKSTPAAPSSSRDREPDPAIVAAAAADAARDAAKGHASKESGSWFGGWFGKKDPNAPAGPIKAKLGEENSFYFDKDLNKWVNKKAGADAASNAAPTPPPPRAAGTPVGNVSLPSSRNVSGGGPPSGPPSGRSTPANGPLGAGFPPKPVPASAVPGSMAPPPRPTSSMSNASSLDDLLGAPGKKAGGAKNKKKGRYVDVMANAS